jgi:hypothetical protein
MERKEFYEVILEDLGHDIQALSDKQISDESLPRRSGTMLLKTKLPKGKEIEVAISLKDLAQKAEAPAPKLSIWLKDVARYVENCAED